MRLRSDISVAALLRQVQGMGGFGAVVKKGEAEAGAIHLLVRRDNTACTHYAPAAQAAYDMPSDAERRFEERGLVADADLPDFIEKESRFDPDFWIVELELAGDQVPFPVVDG